jgi:hypothetical protein
MDGRFNSSMDVESWLLTLSDSNHISVRRH